MLKYAAREFCASTGLHGYRFLVISKRSLLERVIWALIVITSTVTTVAVTMAWFYAKRPLTETVIASPYYPIWNYPFPSITVCNFNQISKSKTYEVIKHIKRSSDFADENLARELRHIIQLLPIDHVPVPQWNLTILQDVLDQNNISSESLFQKLATNCTEMLSQCRWKGEKKRCESIFEQTITTLGFCCSFNYYALKNHTFAGASPDRILKKPRRVATSITVLEVLVNNMPDDYFATDVASYGHKILIHHPYNFPGWSVHDIYLGMKEILFLSINPILTDCKENLKKLSVDKRNCLFYDENDLHNFRYYTYHNCIAECRMRIILVRCGCIPFYYYNENGIFKDVRVCNLRDVTCLSKNKYQNILDDIMSSVPGTHRKFQKNRDDFFKNFEKCVCLPNCKNWEYPLEYSSGEFLKKNAIGVQAFYRRNIQNQSVFTVSFNDLVATKNERFLIYSWHTVFALFGGLVSLFTGFSFGCAFELVYFFVIRLTLKVLQRKYIKNEKFQEKRGNLP